MKLRTAKKIVTPIIWLSFDIKDKRKLKSAESWRKKCCLYLWKRKFGSRLGKEDCRVRKAVDLLMRIIRKEERRNEAKTV